MCMLCIGTHSSSSHTSVGFSAEIIALSALINMIPTNTLQTLSANHNVYISSLIYLHVIIDRRGIGLALSVCTHKMTHTWLRELVIDLLSIELCGY